MLVNPTELAQAKDVLYNKRSALRGGLMLLRKAPMAEREEIAQEIGTLVNEIDILDQQIKLAEVGNAT